MKNLIIRIKNNLFLRLFFIYACIILIGSLIVFSIERVNNKQVRSLFDAIWFSIVSITTTGYGDIIPTTFLGKLMVILLILSGITLTALLTGSLTTIYIDRILQKRSGRMKFISQKNHLVICGWREHMDVFLQHIIDSNQFDAEKIVIIADVPQEQVDEVFDQQKFYGIKYIRGCGYDTNILKRVNIKYAKKSMILSDRSIGGMSFEIDSRIVMTVIALKTMNKNLYVCAQLLEKEFDTYLQRVGCDEIIYSKDINTEILSKAASSNGMSNVLQEFLGISKSGCSLKIEKIKNSFVSKYFKELKLYFYQQFPNDILLGILENTGQKTQISEQAIREAQKTADFVQMVSDLRRVRNLRSYNPILLPSDDYTILENSSIIILRKEYV